MTTTRQGLLIGAFIATAAAFVLLLVVDFSLRGLELPTWSFFGDRETPPQPPSPSTKSAEPQQRQPLMVSRWLGQVLDEAGIPIVLENGDDPDDANRGCILHGKLIWEGKPWLPLRGVEVR
ncbi:MAG: hypothetical protein V3U11_10855, partial [Planctomycetota bacterium]